MKYYIMVFSFSGNVFPVDADRHGIDRMEEFLYGEVRLIYFYEKLQEVCETICSN